MSSSSTPAAAQPGPKASSTASVAPEPPSTTRRVALALGPLLGVLTFFLLPETLSTPGRAVAGIAIFMATWWITEAVPIPVTSLLPIGLFPFLGIASISDTTAPYANSVIFLVLGGILLGLAVQKWNLHLRIALLTVRAFGTRPAQLVFGLMVASAFISMWVSNTATAVIMVPIGGSILILIHSLDERHRTPKLTAAMLLGIAYSITIGSMTTLIGQPPMALMRAYLADNHDYEIGFGQWMLVGVPFGIVMLGAAWIVLTKLVFRSEITEIPGGKELIRKELHDLGPLTTEEKRVMAVFGVAIFSWVFLPLIAAIPAVAEAAPWLDNFNDTGVAIVAAIAMFLLPASRSTGGRLLTWESTRDVPWGVLLLFGGGLSLSAQFTDTGLSAWIGESVSGLSAMPPIVLLMAVAVILIALTELTSNTATAAAFFPIMGAIAVGVGISPLLMTIVVTMAVSCAFMLPVATPSNAVAFATGDLHVQQMVRAGVWLNLMGLVVIFAALYTVVPLVFNVGV